MITAQELRNHSAAEHAKGCAAAKHECTCGFDVRTESVLRTAANHIEGLEIALRGMRERLALARESKP